MKIYSINNSFYQKTNIAFGQKQNNDKRRLEHSIDIIDYMSSEIKSGHHPSIAKIAKMLAMSDYYTRNLCKQLNIPQTSLKELEEIKRTLQEKYEFVYQTKYNPKKPQPIFNKSTVFEPVSYQARVVEGLTEEEKQEQEKAQQVIDMVLEGKYDIETIAEKTGYSKSIIEKIISYYNEQCSIEKIYKALINAYNEADTLNSRNIEDIAGVSYYNVISRINKDERCVELWKKVNHRAELSPELAKKRAEQISAISDFLKSAKQSNHSVTLEDIAHATGLSMNIVEKRLGFVEKNLKTIIQNSTSKTATASQKQDIRSMVYSEIKKALNSGQTKLNIKDIAAKFDIEVEEVNFYVQEYINLHTKQG
ncbi:hypothetical protein IJ670_07230 [bacterium]|nr:hypothetical protein [bacterium]